MQVGYPIAGAFSGRNPKKSAVMLKRNDGSPIAAFSKVKADAAKSLAASMVKYIDAGKG